MAKERYIDRFFDEENDDKIFLKDNDGKEIEFEQVATVDYEANYYAILHPLSKVDGVGEDEGVVFLIDEVEDKLVYIDDTDIIDGVFAAFCEMLDDYDEEE